MTSTNYNRHINNGAAITRQSLNGHAMRMVTLGRIGVVCMVMLVSIASAAAEPITFIWRGTVRGTFNGNALPSTQVIIRAIGDTETWEDGDAGRQMWLPEPPHIEIFGVGLFSFEFSTYIYWNRDLTTGAVGLDSVSFPVVVGPRSPALLNWDLVTPIGPIAGVGSWPALPLDTSGGVLIPVGEQVGFGFTAIVPEPATATLLAFGAFAAAGALRRR